MNTSGRRTRRSIVQPVIGLGLVALVVASACSSGGASPSASSSEAVATATTVATASPTAAPTASPAPTATPTRIATPVPTACAVIPTLGDLPTDRFVDIKVTSTADADLFIFVFGNMSVPGPGGPPVGALTVATPPYTFAGSGKDIPMTVDHVIQVVFRGMSIVADTGDPVYGGPRAVSPALPALQQAVLFDESEGQIGWYLGYDGNGCVTVAHTAKTITLAFAHAG